MEPHEIIIGTPVTYYLVIRGTEKLFPKETTITSELYTIGGQPCCMVEGKSGVIAISHLEKR